MMPKQRLIALSVVLLLALTCFPWSAETRQSQDSDVVAITNATLIDGSGRTPLSDSVVVFKGDRITAVGRRDKVKIPANARIIDAKGMVVAPGFIDTHNHSDR